jgi:hypothetical protein
MSEFNRRVNFMTLEKMRFENIPNIVVDLKPDFDPLINHKNNGDRDIQEVTFENDQERKLANESALILITSIGFWLSSCQYADSRLVGIQMIEKFGCQMSNEHRL